MYRYGTRKGNLNSFENIKIKLGLADLYEVKELNNILFKKTNYGINGIIKNKKHVRL